MAQGGVAVKCLLKLSCAFFFLFCFSTPATAEHYKAAMLLSGVGDALGYRNQLWEYNESGPAIHQVGAVQRGHTAAVMGGTWGAKCRLKGPGQRVDLFNFKAEFKCFQ